MIEQKFQITQDDFGNLNMTFIRPYRAELLKVMRAQVQKMADDSRKLLTSMAHDPKHLHQTITSEAHWLGAGTMVWLRGEFGTIVKYARYVEEGTKTPITPRTARFLRFKYNSGVGSYTKLKRGQYIHARSVRGQEAKPFLRLSFGANKEAAVKALTDALQHAWSAGRRAV